MYFFFQNNIISTVDKTEEKNVYFTHDERCQ